jgi:predicted acyl esterase
MNQQIIATPELEGPVRSETRDGMRIDWDVPIPMDDGLILRADVYRPVAEGRYPVIMSYGPYAKLLHFEDGYVTAWRKMVDEFPDVLANSSNRYQAWEVVDPEKWVPHGYAVVRVDSRGAGRSPGVMNPRNSRETKDYAACIEWGGVQPWSNGKVGLNGISYYAINQWQVAGLQPKHLAAICLWEGMTDHYRDYIYHGGIYCTFAQNWYDMQLKVVQHGLGTRGHKSRLNGELVSGPPTLTDEELGANRIDMWRELFEHPLDDDYHRERSADLSKVKVPLLSAGNWGGQGLHPRGNFEGFVNAASEQKWLEVHGIEHWTHFYTDHGVELQRRFFDYFLKGEDNGWDKQPKVQLQVRSPGEKFVRRFEEAWPIPRTQWTKFHLQSEAYGLARREPAGFADIAFRALGDGVTFLTEPMERETEITGPIAARLQVSSSTTDADLFLIVRLFAPDMKEISFRGALDPHTPIAQGWLRASHRKLDPAKSLHYRPYHPHDEVQPLEPDKPYELDIELWPTCIVVPKGYRIGLSVRGRDYVYSGGSGGRLSNMKNEFTGCGPFLHDDPRDRTMDRFNGETRIHIGGGRQNYLLLPIIPVK